MKIIIKYLIISIILLNFGLIMNNSNANFIEKELGLDLELEKKNLEFVKLKNPYLRNKTNQNKYLRLKEIDIIIRDKIIENYKFDKFSYYKTQGLIKHYNNFIYYSNTYFKSLKNEEIYGKTKETLSNTKKNLVYMKTYYVKFRNLLIK